LRDLKKLERVFARPVAILDPGNFSPQYTANLGSSLAACGVDVTLLTSRPQFGAMLEPAGYRVEICFFGPGSAAGILKSWTARHRRARMALKALAYPAGLRAAYRRLSSLPEPGILHYQWAHLPMLDIGFAAALRRRNWRVVATAHDLLTSQSYWKLLKPHYSRFYRSIDAVIVHTERLAQDAQTEFGVPRSKLHVISRGDLGILKGPLLSRPEARKRAGISSQDPIILFFGMIKPNKGLEHLLRAMPQVLLHHPEARLLIAGEPVESFDRYEQEIGHLGIRRAIITRLGYIRDEDVGSYFQSADLVVLPHTSISLSGVASVAFGYGCSIVGTSIGGLPDILDDGEVGFLVEPGSSAALGEAINFAFSDMKRLAEIGSRGRQRFEARHNWTNTARQTLGLYQRLIRDEL
jgi:glycosyltransferase involved in cell wall biosynthesis